MEHYATILNGPETLAAEILTDAARTGFTIRFNVRYDREATVNVLFVHDVDEAFTHANAWVTQNLCPGCGDTYGSRYHEVAHLADVDTADEEELQAAADMLP